MYKWQHPHTLRDIPMEPLLPVGSSSGWNVWLGVPFSKEEKERKPQRLTSCGESDGESKTAEGIQKLRINPENPETAGRQ